MNIVNKIKKLVSKTNYSISIGYSFSLEQNKDIDNMVKESDDYIALKHANEEGLDMIDSINFRLLKFKKKRIN